MHSSVQVTLRRVAWFFEVKRFIGRRGHGLAKRQGFMQVSGGGVGC